MSADIFVIEPRWTVQAPHLRCVLKRGLALQATQNVWSGTEHINNAAVMAYGNELPDFGRWLLTRSQLRTLKIAIEWRRAKSAAHDRNTAPDILERWTEIEDRMIERTRQRATWRDCTGSDGLPNSQERGLISDAGRGRATPRTDIKGQPALKVDLSPGGP